MPTKKALLITSTALTLSLTGIGPINLIQKPITAQAAGTSNGALESALSSFTKSFEKNTKTGMIVNALIKDDINPLITSAYKDQVSYNNIAKNLFTTSASMIPYGGPILSTVLSLIWPGDLNPNQNPFELIKPQIENLIDEKISDYNQETLKTNFNAIKQNMKYLEQVLNKDTRSEDSSAAEARDRMRYIDQDFVRILELCKVKNLEVSSLPLYAQVAQAHLMFTKYVLSHKNQFGLAPENVTTYKNFLHQRINEYTNYVEKTYQDGLTKVTEKAEKMSDNEIYGPFSAGKGPDYYKYRATQKWNKINEYKRAMTLSALDFVALYPLADIDIYPGEIDTSQAYTREIHSDIVGQVASNRGNDENQVTTLDEINQKMKNREYPGTLNSVRLWTGDRVEALSESFTRPGGQQYSSSIVGNTSSTAPIRYLNIHSDDPITKMTARGQIALQRIGFGDENAHSENSFGVNLERGKNYSFDYEGQQLSDVKAFGMYKWPGFNSVDAIVSSFIPIDVSANNPLNSTAITQISSQKFTEKTGNICSVDEPLNGSNALEFNSKGSSLKYKITAADAGTYKVRYRARINADVDLQLNDQTATHISKKPETYGVYDGPTIHLQKGQNDITLTDVNGGNVGLDKIEFVPVDVKVGQNEQSDVYDATDVKVTYKDGVYKVDFPKGDFEDGRWAIIYINNQRSNSAIRHLETSGYDGNDRIRVTIEKNGQETTVVDRLMKDLPAN
ncbi:TPA: hypothetical protein ROY17_005805 [Bacillus thuringiensis]|nr:hypothetical protein [Bacillus thuringiensis]